MWIFSATFNIAGNIFWTVTSPNYADKEEGIALNVRFHDVKSRRDALKEVEERFKQNNIAWLAPISTLTDKWLWNFDEFAEWLKNPPGSWSIIAMGGSARLPTVKDYCPLWAKGQVEVVVEHEIEEKEVFDKKQKESRIAFVVAKQEMKTLVNKIDPPELAPFIKTFRHNHPDSSKCAFLMMKYEDTPLHKQIIQTIRECCTKHGISALRADDKQYADDLLPNIRTYMHGCGFGITVFERLTSNEFNPNVSLEVGYMMALGKPVCLLKDSTLDALHTDLVGKLYVNFETQRPDSIYPALEKWLADKGLI